jgi:hypothetical protein
VGGRPCSYPGRRGALAVGAMTPILKPPPYCREEEEWGEQKRKGRRRPRATAIRGAGDAAAPASPALRPSLRRVAPRRVVAASSPWDRGAKLPRWGGARRRHCVLALTTGRAMPS